jgi:hypothetical protein
MTFQDLPTDIAERPLTNEKLIADLLDLLIGEQDRHDGCLLLAVCDSESRLIQPIVITEMPGRPDLQVIESAIDIIVSAMADTNPDGAILVALGRRSGLSITADDHAWVRAIERGCHDRVRLLGVHVVTNEGSRPVPALT